MAGREKERRNCDVRRLLILFHVLTQQDRMDFALAYAPIQQHDHARPPCAYPAPPWRLFSTSACSQSASCARSLPFGCGCTSWVLPP